MPGEQQSHQSQPHTYPSPPTAQVSAGAGPFYNHNGSDQTQIPHDLQQLQNADITTRPITGVNVANGTGGNGAAPGTIIGTGTSHHHHHQQAQHNDYHANHTDVHSGAHSVDGSDGQMATPHHQVPTSPQSLAQGVLNMSESHHSSTANFHQTPESTRKRSKTSRACDECRRKKIRCDASEIENETCSNCRRTNARCQFSRQPMKRGPSKGYIKELADRLNTLESQLGPGHSNNHGELHHYMQALPDDSLINQGQEFPSPPTILYSSRKRTHSMLENASFSTPKDYASSSRPWPPEPPLRPPTSSSSNVHDPALTSNAQTRQLLSPNLSLRSGLPDRLRSGERGMSPPDAERDAEAASLVELDEKIVDEYYRIIHQTFPLLPHSKTRLRVLLGKCSTKLREAFLATLECAIRSSPAANVPFDTDLNASVKHAAELIAASPYETTSSRSYSGSLVYIQTLILMALESDNHGPATMKGRVGPPRAEWLGRAIGMATHLKLNVISSRHEFTESDVDSDPKLGRRIWWILFILDRWHASSTSSLLQLPDTSSMLVPEDQIILGEGTYHLARLSYILGHVSSIIQQPQSLMAPDSLSGPIISTTILGEIDRFRESVESVLLSAPNLVHLCYWHVRLLILRLTASTTPHELLLPAARMATTLNSSHTMLTPLNHHFAALAALTLVELTEFEETRRSAEKGIDDLVEALSAHRGLLSREDSLGWDSAIRDLVVGKKRQLSSSATAGSLSTPLQPQQLNANVAGAAGGGGDEGLQHLADAAISGKPRRKDSEGPGTAAAAAPTGENNSTSTAGADAEGGGGGGGGGGNGSTGAEKMQSNAIPVSAASTMYDPTTLTRHGYLTALV